MVARVVQAAQTDSELSVPGWVRFQEVSADIADAFGLSRAGGAVIVDLHEASPLRQAGLIKGDVIQTVNGRDVFRLPMCSSALAR